ncbi:hypothetical protein V8E53_003868 [Lactarius tabidus]
MVEPVWNHAMPSGPLMRTKRVRVSSLQLETLDDGLDRSFISVTAHFSTARPARKPRSWTPVAAHFCILVSAILCVAPNVPESPDRSMPQPPTTTTPPLAMLVASSSAQSAVGGPIIDQWHLTRPGSRIAPFLRSFPLERYATVQGVKLRTVYMWIVNDKTNTAWFVLPLFSFLLIAYACIMCGV